jgi:DNA-binding NarL/FixJ family response regulator
MYGLRKLMAVGRNKNIVYDGQQNLVLEHDMIPIKVLVADDHTLFRDGVKKILSLEKDILVVGEAARGDEVLKAVERNKPDVLILDLRMPKSDVVQTLLDVKERSPATKVLVLTAFAEDESVLNAAKGGARGYLLKGADFATLRQAIKKVHAGGLWIDKEVPAAETFEEIAQGQLDPVMVPQHDAAVESLTRRELEILRLVAEGMTNEEIGKKIFISEKTVKTHLTNIFDKLKVNNRFKAALMIMGQRQE